METSLARENLKVNRFVKRKSLLLMGVFYIQIFSYIVLSNAFTINFGNRFPIKISEFFSIFTILIVAVLFIISNKKISIKKSKEKWVYVWITYIILLDILCIAINKYTFNDFVYGFLYVLRLVHLLIVVKSLHYIMRDQGIKTKNIIRFIKACYFIVVIIGVFQYFFYPIAFDWYDVFYKVGFYWPTPDPHHDRMLSTYLDPNYLASCLIIPISICIAQLLNIRKKSVRNTNLKIKLGFEILVFIVAILLTKSRSGIVGLAFVFVVYAFLYGIKRKISVPMLIFIFVSLFTIAYLLLFSNITVFERIRNFSSDPSAMHRFDSWKISLEYFKDSHYLGIGYNMLGAYKVNIGEEVGNAANYGMDSSILFMLVTTGIAGVLIFLYGIIKIIFNRKKVIINNSLKMILVSSIAMSFFNNLLFNVIWLLPVLLLGTMIEEKKKITIRKKMENNNESIINQ